MRSGQQDEGEAALALIGCNSGPSSLDTPHTWQLIDHLELKILPSNLRSGWLSTEYFLQPAFHNLLPALPSTAASTHQRIEQQPLLQPTSSLLLLLPTTASQRLSRDRNECDAWSLFLPCYASCAPPAVASHCCKLYKPSKFILEALRALHRRCAQMRSKMRSSAQARQELWRWRAVAL